MSSLFGAEKIYGNITGDIMEDDDSEFTETINPSSMLDELRRVVEQTGSEWPEREGFVQLLGIFKQRLSQLSNETSQTDEGFTRQAPSAREAE